MMRAQTESPLMMHSSGKGGAKDSLGHFLHPLDAGMRSMHRIKRMYA